MCMRIAVGGTFLTCPPKAKTLRRPEGAVEQEWAQAAGGVWWDEWEETEAEQERKRRRTDDAPSQVRAAQQLQRIVRSRGNRRCSHYANMNRAHYLLCMLW